MSLSVGIVGLPNVGKSTLFNALTKNAVPAENYPFCTIDPSVGIVPVPDKRLETLASISKSQKIIPAVIEFIDIAGLVKGASSGEGLGNKFLSNIREVDMIAEVVRIFDDEDIAHVSGAVDPLSDIEVINLELMMADLETLSKRLRNIEKEVKKHDAEALNEKKVLTGIMQHLESGKLANSFEYSDNGAVYIQDLHLLTQKPILYVCNKKQGAYNLDDQNDGRWIELEKFFSETNSSFVVIDAGVEHELKDLDEEEKVEFRREYACLDNGIDILISGCYKRLGLMSFFTTGEDETRAWTIKKGSLAPEAGAAIHSDFQDKFIRAQIVSYKDLISAGSISAARDSGKLRTEGKEYVVKDGDVVEFLI